MVDPPDGSNPGQGVGVLGIVQLEKGIGVRGDNTASTNRNAGPAIAVLGHSSIGTGVQGVSNGKAGGAVIGVEGIANVGDSATGVHGQANSKTGTSCVGVFAESDAGMANPRCGRRVRRDRKWPAVSPAGSHAGVAPAGARRRFRL